MKLTPPVRLFDRLGRELRLLFARQPWIRWLAVAAAAAVIGVTVHTRLQAVDAARDRWEQLVRVPVAMAEAAPGQPLVWEWREVPAAVVPDGVATRIDADADARAHVGTGEIVVDTDVASGRGPAGAAEPGQTVVPISDPLVPDPEVGLDVAVFSDGLVLAAAARIVFVDTDAVYVAVDRDDAPLVAAAAQTRQASIAFARP